MVIFKYDLLVECATMNSLDYAKIKKIVRTYDYYHGNASKTARRLRISVPTVIRYLNPKARKKAKLNSSLETKVEKEDHRVLTEPQIKRIKTAYKKYDGYLSEMSRHLPNYRTTIESYCKDMGLKLTHGRYKNKEQEEKLHKKIVLKAYDKYDGNHKKAAKALKTTENAVKEIWKNNRLKIIDLRTLRSQEQRNEKIVVDAYQKYDGNHKEAAKELGKTENFIKKTWEKHELPIINLRIRKNQEKKKEKIAMLKHAIINRSLYIAQKYNLGEFKEIQKVAKEKEPVLHGVYTKYKKYSGSLASISEKVNKRLEHRVWTGSKWHYEELPFMISSLVAAITRLNGKSKKRNRKYIEKTIKKLQIKTNNIFIDAKNAAQVLYHCARLIGKDEAEKYFWENLGILLKKNDAANEYQSLDELISFGEVGGIKINQKLFIFEENLNDYIKENRERLMLGEISGRTLPIKKPKAATLLDSDEELIQEPEPLATPKETDDE